MKTGFSAFLAGALLSLSLQSVLATPLTGTGPDGAAPTWPEIFEQMLADWDNGKTVAENLNTSTGTVKGARALIDDDKTTKIVDVQNGNVGVGKAADGTIRLDVSGAIRADSITATNGITVSGGVIELGANAIQTSEIQDGQITAEKIASQAVTSDKIATDAVTGGHIATDAITGAEITDGAITVDDLADGAITDIKVSNVDWSKLINVPDKTCSPGEYLTGVTKDGKTCEMAGDASATNEVQTLSLVGTTSADRGVNLNSVGGVGGGSVLCMALTGSADLCDGNDDGVTEAQVDGFIGNDITANVLARGDGTKLVDSQITALDTGHVGISVAAPTARLEIGKTTVDETKLLVRAGTTQSNTNPLIKLTNSGGGVEYLRIHSDHPTNTFIGASVGNANTVTGTGREGMDNTFVGSGSGIGNTTGNGNAALGTNTLYDNTIGFSNVAVGLAALRYNIDGNYNNAVGVNALRGNTSGGGNNAFGYQALYSNTTGNNNIGIGYTTLRSNTTGGENIAVGRIALYSNTTGTHNVAIGFNTLNKNTIASYNVAISASALANNLTGIYNIGIGYAALLGNTTASFNTAIGFSAARSNTTGTANVAFGMNSLYSNLTGGYNTVNGYGALYSNTVGSNNVAFGSATGYFNTGSNNVFIGYQAGYNEAGSNKLYIANSNTATPLIYGDFSTAQATINGGLTVTSNITATTAPTLGDHLTNKTYVDGLVGGFTASSWALSTNSQDVYRATGNVGIGTATPAAQLEIAKDSLPGADMVLTSAGSNTGSNLWFRRAEGNLAAPAVVVDGKSLGGINNWGYDGATYRQSSYINFGVDGTPGINDMPGRIQFATAPDGSATPAERLRITSAGRVGIGTTAPSEILDVAGNIKASGNMLATDGTFSGAISAASATVSGNITSATAPTLGDHLVNKTYVDGQIAAIPSSADNLGNHTATQNLVLGSYYLSGDGGDEGVYVAADGKVGIGTAAPSEALEINGNIKAAAFYYTSDQTLKTDIRELSDALAKIQKLQGVSFEWKDSGKKSVGLIAQDVEKVYPELVATDPATGLKSVQYANLVAPLIEAVKDQQDQIESLQAQIAAMQKDLAALKTGK